MGALMALLEMESAPRPMPLRRHFTSGLPLPNVRALNRDHLDELQAFLLRLDRDSRVRRFGHAANDECLVAHVNKSLNEAACVFGVFIDGNLRGVLELYSSAPLPYSEVALVVEKDWRRQGFGWSLLRAAMHWAYDARERALRLIFTRDNWPMRQLTNKANARLDLVFDEICADIAPTPLRQSTRSS
jgi:GNAT superfamily N-acetyltransferase